jgi:solute carrier family 25 protein 39/40
MNAPSVTIYFCTYEILRLSVLKQTSSLYLSAITAGVAARSISVMFSSPLEVLRTYAQAHRLSSGGYTQFIREIYRARGVSGFFTGIGPTLGRDVPFSAFYWFQLEYFTRLRAPYSHYEPLPSLLAGGVAGASSALITMPFDVIKTRQQSSISNDVGFAFVMRNEGVAGFFKGTTARLARTVPACAIMISTYNTVIRFLER